MRVIGLSGYARSGKDTVAEVLAEFGWQRVAFADKLREVALAIDPIVSYFHNTESDEPQPESYRLSNWVSDRGWEGAKANPEVRRLLQVIGTEAGRNILGENIWVDAAFADLEPDGCYVFTDMRFPNEYDAVNKHNGETWRIERPGFKPVNAHVSETAIDDKQFHKTFVNDASLEEFQEKIRNTQSTFCDK